MEADKQDKTDDQLIAEFMGAEPCKINVKSIGVVDGYECGEFKLPIDELEYNKCWSWLMPVVEKINDLGHNGFVRPESKVYKVIDLPIITPIETVYKAVIQFIKWYNSQKPLPL